MPFLRTLSFTTLRPSAEELRPREFIWSCYDWCLEWKSHCQEEKEEYKWTKGMSEEREQRKVSSLWPQRPFLWNVWPLFLGTNSTNWTGCRPRLLVKHMNQGVSPSHHAEICRVVKGHGIPLDGSLNCLFTDH